MLKRELIIHIPVIHSGYLEFFERVFNEVDNIYVIDNSLVDELSNYKPSIASLEPAKAVDILEKFGFAKVKLLTKDLLSTLKDKNLLLVQCEISRELYRKYFPQTDAKWDSVFLRWDRSLVEAEVPPGIDKMEKEEDVAFIKEAYSLAEQSGDWWRQVGAVIVKDNHIVIGAYNEGIPDDHSPYQLGGIRDFFLAGEKQDLSSTIHSEQRVIAEAAKSGIALDQASLYVTHFPCPVCAKMIACSGIKECYFAEGSSYGDSFNVLKSAGIKLIQVVLKN